MTYEYFASSFVDFLIKDGTVSIHQRNQRMLAIEIYKLSNVQSPKYMTNLLSTAMMQTPNVPKS